MSKPESLKPIPTEAGPDMSTQRILSLYPYLYPGTTCWVFDDARTGLKEEAFVEGTTEMITCVVEGKRILHPSAIWGKGLALWRPEVARRSLRTRCGGLIARPAS